jgi:shikimate kinase
VVLVGFMGSGKSTVGPLVARLLGWRFLDMDRMIEERTGLSVARLFDERGERAFRALEREAALEASGLERLVLAAGGGAFAEPETREALRRRAFTVWLRCDLDTILARIPPDGNRPLATNRAIMRGLLVRREASYRLADAAVDASRGEPADVAVRVADAVPDQRRAGGPDTLDR